MIPDQMRIPYGERLAKRLEEKKSRENRALSKRREEKKPRKARGLAGKERPPRAGSRRHTHYPVPIGEHTLENVWKAGPEAKPRELEVLPLAREHGWTGIANDDGAYCKRCFTAKPRDRHGTCEKCRARRPVSKKTRIRAKLEEMAGTDSRPQDGRSSMSAVALGAYATQGKRRLVGKWIFSSEKERIEARAKARSSPPPLQPQADEDRSD